MTVALLLSYVIGAIPFGFLVAWAVLRDDIRRHGSGNIGATNVARVIGGKWGATVLVLDAVKGIVPTWLLPQLALARDAAGFGHLQVGCGVAAILGHMFPAWLKFKGGKGVATALGVVLVLEWRATLVAVVVFAVAVGLTRYVSLGSVLAALTYAATYFLLSGQNAWSPESLGRTVFSTVIPLLIIVRHRSNIGRLLRGEENRFGARPGGKPAG